MYNKCFSQFSNTKQSDIQKWYFTKSNHDRLIFCDSSVDIESDSDINIDDELNALEEEILANDQDITLETVKRDDTISVNPTSNNSSTKNDKNIDFQEDGVQPIKRPTNTLDITKRYVDEIDITDNNHNEDHSDSSDFNIDDALNEIENAIAPIITEKPTRRSKRAKPLEMLTKERTDHLILECIPETIKNRMRLLGDPLITDSGIILSNQVSTDMKESKEREYTLTPPDTIPWWDASFLGVVTKVSSLISVPKQYNREKGIPLPSVHIALTKQERKRLRAERAKIRIKTLRERERLGLSTKQDLKVRTMFSKCGIEMMTAPSRIEKEALSKLQLTGVSNVNALSVEEKRAKKQLLREGYQSYANETLSKECKDHGLVIKPFDNNARYVKGVNGSREQEVLGGVSTRVYLKTAKFSRCIFRFSDDVFKDKRILFKVIKNANDSGLTGFLARTRTQPPVLFVEGVQKFINRYKGLISRRLAYENIIPNNSHADNIAYRSCIAALIWECGDLENRVMNQFISVVGTEYEVEEKLREFGSDVYLLNAWKSTHNL